MNSKIQFNLRVESFTFRINIHNLKKLHLCGYSNETLFLRYKIKFDTLLFYFGLFRMNTVIFENHVGEKRIIQWKLLKTDNLRNGHVKIQSLYMEVEKNGFFEGGHY